MNITYRVSDKHSLLFLAYAVFSYGLYMKHGIIINLVQALLTSHHRRRNSFYHWIKNKQKHKRPRFIVTIAFKDNEPIAALVIDAFYTNIYVKSEYRRQGIATELFKQTSYVYNMTHIINTGDTREAVAFQRKIGIPTRIKDLSDKKMVFL